MEHWTLSLRIYIMNSCYKITTESIKLALDAEQSGASSDLIIPTCNVQKVSYSSSSMHPR